MSSTIDTSLAPLVGLLALVIGIAMYVWLALALSALLRKMGDEAWKGWVPFLNIATILKWGGFNPWLVLLGLVPIAGQIALLVLVVVSAHRINPGFGYGPGMTVLAALLFVVWASILGFGPATWRGARPAGSIPPPPPLPRPQAPTALPGAATPFPPAFGGAVSSPGAAGAVPAMPGRGADPLAAQPLSPPQPAPPVAPAAAPSPGWAPPPPPPPLPPVAATPDEPDVASWPSEIDDVSAVSPSPFPPSAAAAASPRRASSYLDRADDPAGADDGLISFVPGRRSTSTEPAPAERLGAETPVPPTTTPIETQAAPQSAPDEEDWVFPELSGEVSAVVGSPVAGTPISARSSVSAQQRQREAAEAEAAAAPAEPVAVPSDTVSLASLSAAADAGAAADVEEDDVDQTVMVRRKKVSWQLVPASGSPVLLTAEVIVLGRRPSADPLFPRAQLVAVEDEARTVSKTHARLELRGERWLVTDLGSTNGVLVRTLMGDEVEVEPGTELDAGERFFLGDEEFHLQHD